MREQRNEMERKEEERKGKRGNKRNERASGRVFFKCHLRRRKRDTSTLQSSRWLYLPYVQVLIHTGSIEVIKGCMGQVDEWVRVRVRIHVLQVTQADGALVVEGENRLAGGVGRRANSGRHGALQFVKLERRLLRHARTHRLLLICGLTAAGRCGGGALPLVIRDRRLRPHSAARRRRTAAAQHRHRTRLLRERRLERVHHSKL